MIKRLLQLICLLCLLFLAAIGAPSKIFAADFYVDSKFYYDVQATGMTVAEIDISIENATSEKLARQYRLNLMNFEPTNINVRDSQGRDLDFKEIRRDGNSILEITFDNVEAGIGRTNDFLVAFNTYTLAKKTGETWEISVPKLHPDDTVRDYVVIIRAPNSLGEQAFVSPEPSSMGEIGEARLYRFEKNKIVTGNINLVFGKFQTYSFELKYHLENPLEKVTEVELAVPPDTPYQTVIYESIDPEPLDIQPDRDGNWIAFFELEPKKKLDVVLSGNVKIFSFHRDGVVGTRPADLLAYTRATQYWNSDDPRIKELSRQLNTPEAIYNYVVSTLTYDYDRMYSDQSRMGAVRALENKENALCTEFTDLFITLARSAGIPAREINGYAYSNNPRIQPLSLVTDFLHAWPEYWSESEQKWVPVDPTWGSTTGGRDYFNSFDVNHFAFVLHGRSDTKPYPPGSYKLGPEPRKDIFIEPADELPLHQEELSIDVDIPHTRLATNIPVKVKIENQGSGAVYNKNIYIYEDESLVDSYHIESILPHGSHSFLHEVEYGLFAGKAPENLKIVINGDETVVATSKSDLFIMHLLITLASVSVVILLVFSKLKPNLNIFPRLNFDIEARLAKMYKKIKNRNEPIFQNNDEQT